MRRVGSFFVALTILGGLILGWGVPAASVQHTGSLGIRIAEPPKGATDPRARSYIVDAAKPGGTIRSKIVVENNTNQNRPVLMYPGPATNPAAGWLVGEPGASNELVTWTKVSPTEANLKAGAKQLVDVTIQVPKDASEGERYGVIWASISGTGGVTVTNRVGIRIYAYVGLGGAPRASYTINSVSGARTTDGKPAVVANVTNTGKRAAALAGEVGLTAGPGGITAGPFPMGGTVPIGESADIYGVLPAEIPLGPWTATVKFTLQGDTQQKSAIITIPAVAGQQNEGTPPSDSYVVPIVVSVILLLVLLLLLFIFLLRRRRRRGSSPAAVESPPAAPTSIDE